jgi:hypothetical protein
MIEPDATPTPADRQIQTDEFSSKNNNILLASMILFFSLSLKIQNADHWYRLGKYSCFSSSLLSSSSRKGEVIKYA